MEGVSVKIILPDESLSDETFTFKMQEKATVLDLKVAFAEEVGYTPEQLRMVYRTPDMDVPLDDTDLLEELQEQFGRFLVQCPSVTVFDGKFSINYNESMDILVGTKDSFEHFKLTRRRDNLKLPFGMY